MAGRRSNLDWTGTFDIRMKIIMPVSSTKANIGQFLQVATGGSESRLCDRIIGSHHGTVAVKVDRP